MKILIKSTTRLTQTGLVGATLFVAAPLFSLFCAAMYVSKSTSFSTRQEALVWLIVAAIGGISFLIGYVLLSIGKETTSTALSGEDVE